MRISNPKTSTGGPLATTWYVNKRFEGTKKYILSAVTDLSAYVDQETAAVAQASIDRDNILSADFRAADAALSAMSDTRDGELISAFCRYITGNGDTNTPSEFVTQYLPTLSSENPAIYYTPKAYGYAYLDETKKIASELMPDISIMDVNVVDVKVLYDYLQTKGYLTHDATFSDGSKSYYARIQENPSDLQNVLGVVKDCFETYILENQSLDGAIKVYGQGDILVVTWFNFANIEQFDTAFKDVFSQSFMAGAWICNGETRVNDNTDPRYHLNSTIEFVKISFNQGEILSINGIIPASNGNVYLPLSSIYRVSGGQGLIGPELAANLEKVKDTIVDTNAMANVPTAGGLVDFLNVADRFVFDDDTHTVCYAYATINEYMSLNIAAETVRAALSAAIDAEVLRATNDEQIISGALTAETARATQAESELSAAIDYVSGVVGTEADLSGVTVTSALLSLKAYAEVGEANDNLLEDTINGGEDYDTLKVQTLVIPAGEVSDNASDLAAKGISMTAQLYTVAHPDILEDEIYEGDIYNYFGIPRMSPTSKISEIIIDGIKGRILDIYTTKDDDTFEKLDTDISYQVDVAADGVTPVYKSKITLVGEFDGATAATTVLDKMVIRYTNKLTVTLDEPAALF